MASRLSALRWSRPPPARSQTGRNATQGGNASDSETRTTRRSRRIPPSRSRAFGIADRYRAEGAKKLVRARSSRWRTIPRISGVSPLGGTLTYRCRWRSNVSSTSNTTARRPSTPKREAAIQCAGRRTPATRRRPRAERKGRIVGQGTVTCIRSGHPRFDSKPIRRPSSVNANCR